MIKQLRSALTLVALFTLVLGIAYPLGMTAVATTLFPYQAEGSLIERDGRIVGSALIGQPFVGAAYLHPRPSAAGAGHDASASGGSNLGPTSSRLLERLSADIANFGAAYPMQVVPADAVTASASGLDPHISPAYADMQAARIAQARGLEPERVRELIRLLTDGRDLGFLGEPRVNVLIVNLALDRMMTGRDG